jgi:hypothetical protein
MSQGLRITELPDSRKTELDVGDYFIVAEQTGRNTWATRKVDAKYILKLRTEAVNAGADDNEAEILAGTTINQSTQASVLNLRRLKAGSDISLVQSADNIVINAIVNARNEETNVANRAGLFIGKNTNDDLRFKNISGDKGIETIHNNPTRVIVQPKAHHYFFVPANPNNPAVNYLVENKWSKVRNAPGALWPNRPLSGAWNTGAQIVDLTPQYNLLPQSVKDSFNAAEKGLALIRIRFNTNAGGNVGHTLQVKSTEDTTWYTKIEIDPTGGPGTAWEGEDTTTTIVEFNKSTHRFNWRIAVGSTARNSNWEFGTSMWLEGWFI